MNCKRIVAAALFTLSVSTVWTQERGGKLMEEKVNYSAAGISRVTADGAHIRIEVIAEVRDSVEIEVRLPPLLQKMGVEVLHYREDSDLVIRLKRGAVPPIAGKRACITIRVPREMDCALKNSSGPIEVSGIHGNIEVITSSGSQELRNCSGDIKTRSTSGSIRLTNINGSLNIESTSGSITGREIYTSSDSAFQSTSGSIRMDFTRPISDFTFTLRSSSGSLKAGRIDTRGRLESGSGPVTILGKSTSGSQEYSTPDLR